MLFTHTRSGKTRRQRHDGKSVKVERGSVEPPLSFYLSLLSTRLADIQSQGLGLKAASEGYGNLQPFLSAVRDSRNLNSYPHAHRSLPNDFHCNEPFAIGKARAFTHDDFLCAEQDNIRTP